jgi:ferredoxin
MPTVSFLPSHRSVTLAPGGTLHDAARQAGLPIASACGADGLCARCGVEVVAGREHLPPESEDEARAKRRNRIEPNLRLGCRVAPTGNVVITTPYW